MRQKTRGKLRNLKNSTLEQTKTRTDGLLIIMIELLDEVAERLQRGATSE